MRTKILLWTAVLLVSCAHSLEEAQEEEQTVLLEFISPEGTKSVFSEGEMYRAPAVTVYAVGQDGFWKKDIFSSGGKNKMRLPPGQSYTFYALANMGDDTLPTDRNGKLHPEQFVYLIPDRIGALSLQGIPMAAEASADIPARGGELRVSIALQRLLAKVVVKIDKSGITSGADEPVVDSGTLCIRQANRRLMPFSADGSRALSPDDIFSGPLRAFDWHDFGSDGSALTHTDIVLYVPENRQGVLLDQGLEEAKTWDELPSGKAALCTYIEYEGSKDGTRDGVSGPVTYRAYLGNDTADDFSVNRNTLYTATLSLTWDGLMWKADGWRIDTDDLTDSRRLVLSLDNESAEAVSGNSLGKIRRDDYKDVYVNFSRDGGSTWSHGLKDLDDWPYGWDLYIDGVKQEADDHGTTPADIAWDYDGGASHDLLSVYAGSSAVIRSTHTLQVRSADGKVVSNLVRFDVGGKPLGLRWSGGAPQYVAQRGMLLASDLESSSATVIYTVTRGKDKVRLAGAVARNNRMVNIVGSGTVTIQAVCEATDQDDEITFTVGAPQLSLGATAYYANPDGGEAKTGTTGISGSSVTASYSGASGTLTRRSTAATATAVGTYLAADLYDELLAFTPTVDSPLLETICSTGYGTISLHVEALSAGGVTYPSAAGTALGALTVSPRGADTGVSPASAVVRSVNPFSSFPSSVTINTSKDIQDYSVIGHNSSTTTYYASLPTTNASGTSVGFEAFMNDETTSEPTLSALFSKASGGRVTWKDITTDRLTVHTAGVFSLKAYVANRYSGERLYSPVFYKGRLFRHGAVEAYMRPKDEEIGLALWAYVSARYHVKFDRNYSLDRADYYPSTGLGCAFPDVGTHRIDETVQIEWSDYGSHMEKHIGSLTIEVNSDPRPVRAPESDWLYAVHDDCYEAHRYLEATECHEGISDSDSKIYFCTAKVDEPKYRDGYIRRISENTVYLHPDGAPTTTVNGYTVGYFVLHTTKYVADIWL